MQVLLEILIQHHRKNIQSDNNLINHHYTILIKVDLP